jgi:DNA repair protein RecO (recombination protein O)
MLVTTKAIVLSAIKYSDADLIVKCYTQEGLKSYMLKRILKSKKGKLKAAYFQPLTQLELIANHNTKGTLNFIREAKLSYPYNSIGVNITKQTIALFLSEVLSKSIREEEVNKQLFEFVETALIWLDTHSDVSNFHLLFLINLTKHLGFYPEKEQNKALFFDLEEGCFTNSIPRKNVVSGENLIHLKALLGINFEGLHKLRFNGSTRQEILDILIQYFELHLPGFTRPKSLAILKTVFE